MPEDNHDNIVLERLREIRSLLDGIKDTQSEHGRRLTHLESGQAQIITLIGQLGSADAEQQGRYDRLVERIERLERRLELRDDA